MKSYQIPSDILEKGVFQMPGFIYDADTPLDYRERALFAALIAEEARIRKACPTVDWFGVINPRLCACAGFSDERSMRTAREKLRRKGLIDFKRGNTGRSTEYKIQLDDFYWY